MCCLFGILDYKGQMSLKERQRVLKVLSIECEDRGIDATGIAYYVGGHLTLQKAPKPAHRMKFKLSNEARFIMGHTRMATQGSEKLNYNNHPFSGKAGGKSFTLAHNGVLYNEDSLRREHGIPKPKIETDSYVAVQILEQIGKIDFLSLAKLAESVQGTFNFTVLDRDNNLYIVRGNNPMCIMEFPEEGFYLYASTKEILSHAVVKLNLHKQKIEEIPIKQGEILKITPQGTLERSVFNDEHITAHFPRRFGWYDWDDGWFPGMRAPADDTVEDAYLEDLISMGVYFGVDREIICQLRDFGFTPTDIEEMFYDPELLEVCLDEMLNEYAR